MRKLPLLMYGQDKIVSEWVASIIPDVAIAGGGFKNCTAIGVYSDEVGMMAGVVYSDYYPAFETIQLSIAAVNPMWARREIITALLSYPFEQLNVFKCWVTIPLDNQASLEMTEHVGFRQEAILKHQFGKNRHAVIKRMFKPDFKRLYRSASQ